MRYLFNVGLIESATIGNAGAIPAFKALSAVRRALDFVLPDAAIVGHRLHQSDTEPTLVVEVDTDIPRLGAVSAAADLLAVELKQEAIAVAPLSADGVSWGVLRGPMAERWGAFNPAYFLLLDGKRAAPAPLEEAA